MANDKPVSPIKDSDGKVSTPTNGDGILQGSEIVAQLQSEEEAGGKRTSNEKVHGILEAFGLRNYAQKYLNNFLIARSSGDAAAIAQVQQTAATYLQSMLTAGPQMVLEPEFQRDINGKRSEIQGDMSLSQSDKKVALADLTNLQAFAEAAKVTFPKGVKISPEEAHEIIRHFAGPKVIEQQKIQDGVRI